MLGIEAALVVPVVDVRLAHLGFGTPVSVPNNQRRLVSQAASIAKPSVTEVIVLGERQPLIETAGG
jgi:hypothetical protein